MLLIGSSLSAHDIALTLVKYGAKSVTISWRSKKPNAAWPNKVTYSPLLTKVDENGVAYFRDDSSRKIDSIILCTGYKFEFPFLAENLKIQTTNRMFPSQLYKGIFHAQYPNLIFIGMFNIWLSVI